MTSDKAPTPTDADRYTRMTRRQLLAEQCSLAFATEPPCRTENTLVRRSQPAVSGLLPKKPGQPHEVESAEDAIVASAHVERSSVISLSRLTWTDSPGAHLGSLNQSVNGWGIDLAAATLVATRLLFESLRVRFISPQRKTASDYLLLELARKAHSLVAKGQVGLGERAKLTDQLLRLNVDDIARFLEEKFAGEGGVFIRATLPPELWEIYARNRTAMIKIIKDRGVKNPADVDDVISECLVKWAATVHKSSERMTGSYLKSIARSAVADFFHKRRHESLSDSQTEEFELRGGAEDREPARELFVLRDAIKLAERTSAYHSAVHSWVAQQLDDLMRDGDTQGSFDLHVDVGDLIRHLYDSAGPVLHRTSTKETVAETLDELKSALRRNRTIN